VNNNNKTDKYTKLQSHWPNMIIRHEIDQIFKPSFVELKFQEKCK